MNYINKIFVLIVFLLITVCGNSQNIKTIFTLIEKKQYNEAFFLLEKKKRKTIDIPVIYYAYSLVYLPKESSVFDLQKSYYSACYGDSVFTTFDKKQQSQIINKYKVSAARFAALRNNIAIDIFETINKKDTAALRKFIKNYPEKISRKADELLLEIIAFSQIDTDSSLTFLKMLIDKYPNNEQIGKAWLRYFYLSTLDGTELSLTRFKLMHPQFPFPNVYNQELTIAQLAADKKCTREITYSNHKDCDRYIRLAAPKRTAFITLQKFLKPFIDTKQWNEALEKALEYKDVFKNNKSYKELIAVLQKPTEGIIKESIGSIINTETGNEFSPLLTLDDQRLYFSGAGRRDNMGGEDIFYSDFNGKSWTRPILLKGINTPNGNEAPEAISADEKTIIMFYNGDMIEYQKVGGEWTNKKPLNELNTALWDGDACLSADGNVLFFVSEGWNKVGIQYPTQGREDSYDIYVSIRKGNSWSTPINLGTTINTPWCDRYPFIHPDGKTLYFSSNGHSGLGGTDVFRSVRLNDSSWTQWSKPINLGKEINTSGNDNGYKISTKGTKAYFSVNNGTHIDIYQTDLPKEHRPQKVQIVRGTVSDNGTTPLRVEISVFDAETGTLFTQTISDEKTGAFIFALPTDKKYSYFAYTDSYLLKSDIIQIKQDTEIQPLDIQMTALKNIKVQETSLVLRNVFFDSNKHQLKQESFIELNYMAKILKSNPIYTWEISGHTDSTGTQDYNFALSKLRAEAVKDYLVQAGCNPKQLIAVGKGSDESIALNSTEEGKRLNRRVEIKIKQ
ncbi:MAG: OmpA family protein [Bacteroidales bacterium]